MTHNITHFEKSNPDSFRFVIISIQYSIAGGSSGSAVHAACQLAKKLSSDQRCVVILPDGIRNYMTKFVSDEWLTEKGLLTNGHTAEH